MAVEEAVEAAAVVAVVAAVAAVVEVVEEALAAPAEVGKATPWVDGRRAREFCVRLSDLHAQVV